MSLIVSNIVGVVYEQSSIVNNVCADVWPAKLVIIASNGLWEKNVNVVWTEKSDWTSTIWKNKLKLKEPE